MKRIILIGFALLVAQVTFAQDLPTNPEPGKCYVRCVTPDVWVNQDVTVQTAPAYKTLRTFPAEFKTVEEEVIGKAAGRELEVIPAVYKTEGFEVPTAEASYSLEIIPETMETVQETIVVSGASQALEVIPAVYENQTFEVLVTPAYTRLKVVPAVYETKTQSVVCKIKDKRLEIVSGEWGTEQVTYRKREFGTNISIVPATFTTDYETIEVKPATARWEMSDTPAADCASADPNDCRYWCYKGIPAEFTTVPKTVLTKDATIERNNECDDPDCGQAAYTKRIQTTPPTVREINIPEIVKTYNTKVMVSPPTTVEVTVPAVTKTFTKRIMVTPPTTRVIEIPAVTKTVSKKVVRPATTRRVDIPGNTKTMQRTVLVSPATTRTIDIPSNNKTLTKTVLVKDSYTTENQVAAKFQTVSKEVLQSKGGLTTWKEVECALVEYQALPINWNLGSATLTPQAKNIIDTRLMPVLANNPGVKLEIASHTDSRGGATSNQDLSERRAQAVVTYLGTKGVNNSILVGNGYGERKLTNRCKDGVSCTEREHAANRRTSFRLINN